MLHEEVEKFSRLSGEGGMKDIIYREDAIRYFIGLQALDKITNENYDGKITFEEVISRLGVIPSAERTGHWIKDGHHIICDQCGATMCDTDREGDPIPRDFCPSCGVRMVTA